jgi:hypothetical protein
VSQRHVDPRGITGVRRTTNRAGRNHGNPDDGQASFFDVPRARNHITADGHLVRDPSTSFEAARSITPEKISTTQRAIFNTLQLAGQPLTDEQIYERVQRISWGLAVETVRSRRAELLRRGLIEVADEDGTTSHGRRCRRYRVRSKEIGIPFESRADAVGISAGAGDD